MKKLLSKKSYILASVILFVIDFIITGYIGVYIWNNIFSVVFGIMTLTFWQCWAVVFCISFFTPRSNKETDDYVEKLITDIILTLVIGLISYLAVTYIGF